MSWTKQKSAEAPQGNAPDAAAAELALHALIRLLARRAVADFFAEPTTSLDLTVPPTHSQTNSKKET